MTVKHNAVTIVLTPLLLINVKEPLTLSSTSGLIGELGPQSVRVSPSLTPQTVETMRMVHTQ